MSQLPRTSLKKWTPRISRLNPTAAASRTAPATSGTFHRADAAGSSKNSATPITTIELSEWPLGKGIFVGVADRIHGYRPGPTDQHFEDGAQMLVSSQPNNATPDRNRP